MNFADGVISLTLQEALRPCDLCLWLSEAIGLPAPVTFAPSLFTHSCIMSEYGIFPTF